MAALLRTFRIDLRTAKLRLVPGFVALVVLFTPDRSFHNAVADEVERIAITPSKARQPISLRDRLVVGLQARLKSEVAYVELVALRVRTGQLPQRLVDETFFWARQRATDVRRGRSRRPIIYFQPAMTARAKRLNVAL